MRKNVRIQKLLCFLLALSMVMQYVPMAGFAAAEDNLCEHHTEHTAECGYTEGESDCAFHCDECLGHVHDDGEIPEEVPVTVEDTHTFATEYAVPDVDLPDNDELFAMYAEQKFYGYEMATFGTRAKERLNDAEKGLYDVLKSRIESVASSGGITEFVVTSVPGLTTSWTNTELGVESIEDVDVSEAMFSQFDYDRVAMALLDDCPFDLYWFDKTAGYGMYYQYGRSGYGGVYTSATVTSMTFTFKVSADYQGGSNTVVTTDVNKVNAVKAAAQSVVNANASKSDYEKLVAYKNYICGAVSYNSAAASNSYTGGYGDPWQLIYVFDGDSSTNVVCEGYSKAFQYLCDLGGLDCISVSGYMNGGGHMWNVVTLGGKNYLVDVTNVDDGTIGSDGSLFMAGGTYNGSGYVFTCYGSPVTFTCDNLNLAAENYTPDPGSTEHVHSYSASNPTCSCGMIGYCGGEDDGTNLTWTVSEDGKTITISGTGAMADFNDPGYAPWFEEFGNTLTKAVIEPGVTTIGGAAFWSYPALETVTIPEGVTNIGIFTFAETALKKVVLPDSLVRFGMGAFYGCTSLAEVNIPDGVTEIDMMAFQGCSSLTSVTLPDGVYIISAGAFANCSSLKKVNIPASVSFFDAEIFEGTALEEVTVPCNWDNTQYVFDESVLRYAHHIGDLIPAQDAVHTAEELKAGVAAHYFCDICENYLDEAKNVTTLEALAGAVPAHDFANEANRVPGTCVAPGYVTMACVCGATATETLPMDASNHNFDAENPTCACGMIGYCGGEGDGTNLTWTYEDGTLTISGTGTMVDYTRESDAPWYRYRGTIVSIEIADDVTSIGNNAFYMCKITEITIPESVTSIGSGAFTACAITEVNIPKNVTNIDDYPFCLCSSLMSIGVDENNPAYSSDSNGILFNKDKTDLVQVPGGLSIDYTIPDTVTNIHDGAFYSCSLTKITIPETITSIGEHAFRESTNLKEINIPDSITSIGDYAFSVCTHLKEIAIPASVTSIGEAAFLWCESLEKITFYGNAPTVVATVFDTVTATAYYPAGNATWTEDVMQNYGGDITWIAQYPMLEGNDTVITPDNTPELSLRAECEITKFEGVTVDGEPVDPANYTVTEGSTIVTFTTEYLQTLSEGEHTVALHFTDGISLATVTVENTDFLLGDVTGDGKVTAADYSRLLAHVKKTNVITDETTLKAADVTGDGKITAADYSRLLAHVKKVNPLW